MELLLNSSPFVYVQFIMFRLFFDQLGTILLMAVVGTIFNMFTIGKYFNH
jgi:hypothetical protein